MPMTQTAKSGVKTPNKHRAKYWQDSPAIVWITNYSYLSDSSYSAFSTLGSSLFTRNLDRRDGTYTLIVAGGMERLHYSFVAMLMLQLFK